MEADSNGDDAERAPWSHEEWGQYPLRQAPGEMPLDSLARELSTTPGLRQCIPDALLRAALAFGEDAKLACLVALFQIGFVDVRTRGEMLGNSTMAICSICTASPAQISYLVRLFACSYTLVPASDCEGLSKGLSFVGWAPDPTLIREAQGWLLRDFGAAGSSSSSGGFHALGKLVLENAPWSAMSPTLNQYAGYLIIEVMETLRNPAASPFSFLAGATVATAPRKMRDDLMRWCWAMLLRFNYAVPTETKKKKKRIPAAASADGGNEGNVAESEGEVKDAVADENVEEEEEEEEEEFFVVKKNTSSFRVLVPENEDEKKYLREITVITDAATVVNKSRAYIFIFCVCVQLLTLCLMCSTSTTSSQGV